MVGADQRVFSLQVSQGPLEIFAAAPTPPLDTQYNNYSRVPTAPTVQRTSIRSGGTVGYLPEYDQSKQVWCPSTQGYILKYLAKHTLIVRITSTV